MLEFPALFPLSFHSFRSIKRTPLLFPFPCLYFLRSLIRSFSAPSSAPLSCNPVSSDLSLLNSDLSLLNHTPLDSVVVSASLPYASQLLVSATTPRNLTQPQVGRFAKSL
ncbi:hypothetical protein PGTUg99_009078 [Puccinia graminis f. sp. tritici]|uniref:Uncharacterized protein n=1 Tax=Puccinia graminis f. sp. tritici TaxID=56615 RepID=A0A5B0QZ35_PUCGR|nr:hypothetical protein PGTUg99_009078 [Puccinia graminis f. sp. tritici]